jgi:glycosyltransferase involved in cell wall biosynthesis
VERLSIIIPCYNEQDGIAHLVSQLEPVRRELQNEGELDQATR